MLKTTPHFSTKEAAEEYIKYSQKTLSINDVLEILPKLSENKKSLFLKKLKD